MLNQSSQQRHNAIERGPSREIDASCDLHWIRLVEVLCDCCLAAIADGGEGGRVDGDDGEL